MSQRRLFHSSLHKFRSLRTRTQGLISCVQILKKIKKKSKISYSYRPNKGCHLAGQTHFCYQVAVGYAGAPSPLEWKTPGCISDGTRAFFFAKVNGDAALVLPIRATSTRGERRAVRNRARFYILAPTVVALVLLPFNCIIIMAQL